jgi:hypothetical protein
MNYMVQNERYKDFILNYLRKKKRGATARNILWHFPFLRAQKYNVLKVFSLLRQLEYEGKAERQIVGRHYKWYIVREEA